MKKVTAILIGAGQRGAGAYASYALQYPNELEFVGVAEIRPERLKEFKDLHGILENNCFSSWEEILSQPKMADCALICTQDQMHFQPILQAEEKGYHILCEKPITADKLELLAIDQLARTTQKTISVCHVLRYSPFFTEIKKILDSGKIGELVTIQHMESIGYWHMAHSFVRGNWSNTEESCPIILAKCCHDLDILLWLVGAHCTQVSSFGGLKHFTQANAPKDAPKNCMEGCPNRDSCPFYAPRFYLEHAKAISDGYTKVVSIDTGRDAVLKALAEGPYGRCVYHCENNAADHQVVNLEYDNGVTASLTMSAFTNKCERTITLMGTRGQIKGNMEENKIELVDFVSGNTTEICLSTPNTGHSGSDVSMMKHFADLVRADGKKDNVSAATEAVESHLIALAAEESRIANGMAVSMETFKAKK